MPRTTRQRVDWMPGAAAQQALLVAADKWPDLNTQAIIDKLVICGLSALLQRWEPPSLYGRDRDRWRLPRNLLTESDRQSADQ